MNNKPFRLSIVLLAAGESKRFQGNKMLANVEGKSMYLHMVEKIQDIPAFEKVIVTQYQEIIDFFNNTIHDNSIKTIKNNHAEWGISYSIRLGIEHTSSLLQQRGELDSNKVVDAYLFAVCDQPWLNKESIVKLIDVFSKSNKGIACLSYKERLGNPVIFDGSYKEELLRLQGDTGGKFILKQHINDVVLVEVKDSKELLDIDTKQEYIRESY